MAASNNNNCESCRSKKKKLKPEKKPRDAVGELHAYCRKLRCKIPTYTSKDHETILTLSGSYLFSKSPDFIPKAKAKTRLEAKQDVAKQALRWIQHNDPPSFHWKDRDAENTLTDLIAELAESIYESSPSSEVKKVVIYLEGVAIAKFQARLETKAVPRSSIATPEYRQALDVCRLPQVAAIGMTIVSDAEDKGHRLAALSERNSVSYQEKATLKESVAKSAYGFDTSAPAHAHRRAPFEILPRHANDTELARWLDNFSELYDKYRNDHARLRFISAVLSATGDSFVTKLHELSTESPLKGISLLEFILQRYSPEIIKSLSTRGQVNNISPECRLAHILDMSESGLLPTFSTVVKELGDKAETHLQHFLQWHKNGMLNTVLTLSVFVGNRTPEFIKRLLDLESTKLLPLIDAVIAETNGEPVPLLQCFLRWNKNDVAERLLDFEAHNEGNAMSLVEAALEFGKLGVLPYVKNLLTESRFDGTPYHFFRQLCKWQTNKSLHQLCNIDRATAGNTPEFLNLAFRHTQFWTAETRHRKQRIDWTATIPFLRHHVQSVGIDSKRRSNYRGSRCTWEFYERCNAKSETKAPQHSSLVKAARLSRGQGKERFDKPSKGKPGSRGRGSASQGPSSPS
ncbi:hypothetical protein SBOR_8577 [Sclerotinia borealis F-4128]|uniref:Uncharacterized protein n=1 Tax=Sclerotinia borealis (strain F-4128) TaxID=1432307 RepID=W9C8Y6_SCLBF|nr:hypothetical protein SBOR_8577 [Sclerotinia borealis F-4128]